MRRNLPGPILSNLPDNQRTRRDNPVKKPSTPRRSATISE
jgi:hypothetical protein